MNNPIFVVLLTLSIFLAACGAPSATVNSPGTIPGPLQTIEEGAEDIIDFVPSGNWERINKDVTDIENAWKSYEPQAKQDGATPELETLMHSAITELKTASQAKDASATMQSSNDVSAAVIELFALYNPVIPANIGRLDVLERQVILDVAAQDYSAAMQTLTKTQSVWEEVKPSVLEHNGEDVAAQFEASLAAQESAVEDQDDQELTQEARDGLELVDVLERLY